MLLRFVTRRLAVAIIQLIGISLFVFFMIRILPADPVARLVGLNATKEAYDLAAHNLGLDQPWGQQLLNYLGIYSNRPGDGVLQGDLGDSWVTSAPILEELVRFLPITLEFITYALLIAFLIAVPMAMAAATKPGKTADRVTFVWGLFAGAQPEFWWGLMFVFFFFFQFHEWGFPSAPAPLGRLNPMVSEPHTVTGFILIDSLIAGNFRAFLDGAHHLMLPVFTLVFVVSGAIIKMLRQNMIRVLQSDYILYARSAGLPARQVGFYAMRAAMAPAMTLVGIFYGFLLGGAVPIELIYSLGGIGEYSIRSILAFDYPAIQGTVLIIAMVSLLIYLVIDILHAAIDPRVTF